MLSFQREEANQSIDELASSLDNGGGVHAEASISVGVSVQEKIEKRKIIKARLAKQLEELSETYARLMTKKALKTEEVLSLKAKHHKQKQAWIYYQTGHYQWIHF